MPRPLRACSRCGEPTQGLVCRPCIKERAEAAAKHCSDCGACLHHSAKGQRCASCRNEMPQLRAVIDETASVAPALESVPQGSGDWMVLPDPHVPFHNPATVLRCCRDAVTLGIRQLVVPGDLIHADTISKYVGAGKQVALSDELIACGKVLNALSSVFDRIVVTMGNHDQRVERMVAGWANTKDGRAALDIVAAALGATSTDAQDVASSIFGRFFGSPFVEVYPLPDIEINGRWLLLHPGSARRISPQNERSLAHKHRKSIICGHSHLFAVGFDDSGQDVAANIGHAADETKWRYIREKPTNFPAMVRGYAAIICDEDAPHGRLLPLADHPLWFDLGRLKQRMDAAA